MEPESGTLRKHGVRIRLQEQPFRVLLALLEKPGEVVTREELQRRVWTGSAFGDFEHSLNIAVNKIRESQGDSADGSTLAALTAPLKRGQAVARRPLMLYRFSEGNWQELPDAVQCSWPSWSHDGQSIWWVNYGRGAILRHRVRENRHEEMVQLRREEMTGAGGTWFNLTPGDEPMILRRRDIQQIYALDWKPR